MTPEPDMSLIMEALEIALDLAIDNVNETTVKYQGGFKPEKIEMAKLWLQKIEEAILEVCK